MKKPAFFLIELLNAYLLLSISLIAVGNTPQQVRAGTTSLRIAVGKETATDINYVQIESWLNYWGLSYSEVTNFTSVNRGQYDVIIYGRASQASQYYLSDAELNNLRDLYGNGANLIFMDGYDIMNNTRRAWETFEWNVFGINMSNSFGDAGLQNWRVLKRNSINYTVAPEWQAMLNDSSELTYFGDLRYVSGWNTATEILGCRYSQFTNRTLFTVNAHGSDLAYLIQPSMVYINRASFQTDNNVVLGDAMFRYAIDEISLRLAGEYATRHAALYSSFEIDDWLGAPDVQTSLADIHATEDLKITFVVPHIESQDIGENMRLAGLQYFKDNKDWIEARSHSYRHEDHTKFPQSYLDDDPSLMVSSLLADGVQYPNYVTFQGESANKTVLEAWTGYATHIIGISLLAGIPNLVNGSLYAGYKGLQIWGRIFIADAMANTNDTASAKGIAWRMWEQNQPMIFWTHAEWRGTYARSVYRTLKEWVQHMGGIVEWTSEVIRDMVETKKLSHASSSGTILESSATNVIVVGSKESHIVIPVAFEYHVESIYYSYSSSIHQIDVYPIQGNIMTINLTSGQGNLHITHLDQDVFVNTLYQIGTSFSSYTPHEKLTYTVYGIAQTMRTMEIFLDGEGEPLTISGSDTWSYDSGTQIATVNFTHAGREEITAYWIETTNIPPITTMNPKGTLGLNNWFKSEVTVALSATDDISGVNKTEYSFNNSTWITYWTPFTISNEGNTTIYFKSTDNVGNVENIKSGIIKIDKTQPTASAGSNRTINERTSIEFDGSASSDNIGIVSYEWNFGDGGTGTGIKAAHSYFFVATYTLTLTVKDAAGNVATDSITVTVLPSGASGGGTSFFLR